MRSLTKGPRAEGRDVNRLQCSELTCWRPAVPAREEQKAALGCHGASLSILCLGPDTGV